MIPAKFGQYQTDRSDVIAILANFKRRPAAILDFAKISLLTLCLQCREEAWFEM